MADVLFAPASTRTTSSRPAPVRVPWVVRIPLFWRIVAVNIVVVLGGSIAATWITERFVSGRALTVATHALLVLGALVLAAACTMLLLRETFRPIRSLEDAIKRINAGDRTARAQISPLADPDIAALVAEVNGLWDRLEADAATIREATDQAELLAAQVLTAQEDERRRVARELHDEAGQALTALVIGLERGLAAMPENYGPELRVQPRQMVSDLRDLAARTLDEVRHLAWELRPSTLDDLGLVPALTQFASSIEERTGIACSVAVKGMDDEDRLPSAVETAVYRIAQEATTNAVRHAQAHSITIRLRREPEQLVLDVRDDGVGLAAADAETGHMGLFGMRERTRLLQGDLSISLVSPRGTLIRATLPLGHDN